jgi:hypothetical protein
MPIQHNLKQYLVTVPDFFKPPFLEYEVMRFDFAIEHLHHHFLIAFIGAVIYYPLDQEKKSQPFPPLPLGDSRQGQKSNTYCIS